MSLGDLVNRAMFRFFKRTGLILRIKGNDVLIHTPFQKVAVMRLKAVCQPPPEEEEDFPAYSTMLCGRTLHLFRMNSHLNHSEKQTFNSLVGLKVFLFNRFHPGVHPL